LGTKVSSNINYNLRKYGVDLLSWVLIEMN
jgi:hypothetical protein